MNATACCLLATILGALCAEVPDSSQGALGFAEGNWRLELGEFAALFDADAYTLAAVEYEFPVSPRTKLGLRMYPLFLLHDPEPIYGVGGGIGAKLFLKKNAYEGVFGQAGASTLWHSRNFDGNGSRVNFLTEVGIGYRFPGSSWDVTAKFEHISNAHFNSDNRGINGLGLAVGFSF